jgi:hypothetical protein
MDSAIGGVSGTFETALGNFAIIVGAGENASWK